MKSFPTRVEEYKTIIQSYSPEKVSELKIILRKSDNPPVGIIQFRDLALSCLYLFDKKSGYQIAEEYPNLFLSKNYRPLTARVILHILRKYGITRTNASSLVLRIKTGRMKYENRHFDYRRRSKKQYKKWTFAPRLFRVLQLKNMNIDLLAKKIGVHKRNVYAWGICRSRVSPENQEKIINSLNTTYKAIFTRRKVRRIGQNSSLKKKGYLAKNLDQHLRDAQLTKEELGRMVGVSGYIVTNWKQKRTFVAPRLVEKIAKIFDAKVEDIFALDYIKYR